MVSGSSLRVLCSGEVGSQPPEIDVVVVHGLNPFGDDNHAESTWTADNKLWLRDFLPEKLPKARIMLFAYNANVAFNPVDLRVRDHSMKLLELLQLQREDAAHRPILFVCHSLGGLVVKRALIIAQTTKEYGDLKNATYGIIFFGTPHRGGNLVALGRFLSWTIRHTTPGKAKNNLLDSLETNGFFTDELREDFRQQLEDYHLISYFEEENTKIMGKDIGKIVERESATFGLSLDREKTLGLSGDHSSMCKFSSAQDSDYELVAGRVVKMAKGAVKARRDAVDLLALRPSGIIQDISLHGRDLQKFLLTKWLAAPNERARFDIVKRSRAKPPAPATGSWFMNSERYHDWTAQAGVFSTGSSQPVKDTASWLWLYGIPGCGKTVLNATVLDTLLQQYSASSECAIVYYYFDFSEKNVGVCDVVKSLIRQLLDKTDDFSALWNLYQGKYTYGLSDATLEDLLSVFEAMAGTFSNTYILVDALDECGEKGDLKLLFQSIASWSSTHARVFLTSRREDDVATMLRRVVPEACTLQIKTADVDVDIRTYLQNELHNGETGQHFEDWEEDSDYPGPVTHRIIDNVASNANGMFLLARLQLEALKKCVNALSLDKALKDLPKDLNMTYERILKGIDKGFRSQVIRILRWLTFSHENMSVKQVEQIFTVVGDEDDPDAQLEFDPRGRLRKGRDYLYQICSSLISITADPKTDRDRVSLAHASVSDFIREHSGATSSWVGRIRRDPHGAIARVCLTYLQQFDKRNAFKSPPLPTLARYAAQYWSRHALKVSVPNQGLDRQMTELFTKDGDSGVVFQNWIRLFDPDRPEDDPEFTRASFDISTPWYYACLLGLDNVIRHHIGGSKDDVDSERGFAGNGLQAASSRGHLSTVRLLLQAGANINFRLSPGELDALQNASWRGEESVVKLLLERGANANPKAPGGYWGYALHAAAYEGHEKIVEILLNAGANPNAVGGYWDTALTAASWGRHIGIVRLLLGRGANANTKGPRLGTALLAVSNEGHLQIAELLIEQGHANINTIAGGPESHGFALAAAAGSGYTELVKLLIRKGANVNLQGGRYGTALIAAVGMGKIHSVQELLAERANVHAQVAGCAYKNAVEASLSPLSVENIATRTAIRSLLRDWMRDHPESESQILHHHSN